MPACVCRIATHTDLRRQARILSGCEGRTAHHPEVSVVVLGRRSRKPPGAGSFAKKCAGRPSACKMNESEH